jgi:glycosyltransferase involved in cell wall biosynthesis
MDAGEAEPGDVMRILLAVHHFPPRRLGGVELEALRVARALEARGHLIQVLCVDEIDRGRPGEISAQDDAVDGVAVQRLSFNRAALAPRAEYDNQLVGAHVDRLLTAWRPDVLHVMSGYLLTASALTAARARGVPTVVSLTDMWFLCPRITMQRSDGTWSAPPLDAARCVRCLAEEQRRYRLPGRLAPSLMSWYWSQHADRIRAIEDRQAFLRGTLGHTDALLSRSAFLRSMFEQAGAVAPGRILVIAPGRDTGVAPGPKRPASGMLRVGFIGTVAPHKGPHVVVAAMKLLSGAPLALALYGDWEAFPRYADELRRAASADARIRCLPRFDGDAGLASAHQAIDVLVVPSLWHENVPNVVLEAFLHDTPVVASRAGGISEVVADGRGGLLFEPGNARDLATALRRLVDDPVLLGRLRQSIPPVRAQSDEIAEIEGVYQRVAAR